WHPACGEDHNQGLAGLAHRPPAQPDRGRERADRLRAPVHAAAFTFHPITFEEQKQAMIDVGLPEAVAEDNATAVALMADGDCDYVTDDVPSTLRRPARS